MDPCPAAPAAAAIACTALLAGACSAPRDPHAYRLRDSGDLWHESRGDRVFDDIEPRYREYFEVILDPSTTREPDLRPLRRDLERSPSDRHSFDALNAIAIGYFELSYRAHASPGGPTYFGDSTRAARLLAVPWRAYGEVESAPLRDAILDFFEDAGAGEKRGSATTAGRLVPIVESLARKEPDPARRARILAVAAEIRERSGAPP